MERSPPTHVLGCYVSAVLDEEPRDTEMTAGGRLMERSPPALVLGCHAGAVLNEELRKIVMTPL
jgi:hypothetical protein